MAGAGIRVITSWLVNGRRLMSSQLSKPRRVSLFTVLTILLIFLQNKT